MAAAAAVDEICTPEVLDHAENINNGALDAMDEIIARYELPPTTVGFGVKGAVTWATPRCATTATTSARTSRPQNSAGCGHQPQHPHPARSGRAVAGFGGAHPAGHGACSSMKFDELAQALRG